MAHRGLPDLPRTDFLSAQLHHCVLSPQCPHTCLSQCLECNRKFLLLTPFCSPRPSSDTSFGKFFWPSPPALLAFITLVYCLLTQPSLQSAPEGRGCARLILAFLVLVGAPGTFMCRIKGGSPFPRHRVDTEVLYIHDNAKESSCPIANYFWYRRSQILLSLTLIFRGVVFQHSPFSLY